MSLTIRSIDDQLAIRVQPYHDQLNLIFELKSGDAWGWIIDKDDAIRFVMKSKSACRGDRAYWISQQTDPDQMLTIKMVRRGHLAVDIISIDDDDLFQVEDAQFHVSDWESFTANISGFIVA